MEATLADWVWVTLQAQPDDPIALDGKAVRGAGCTDQAATHLLVCCTHHSQETLFQVRVECKPNKIPIAQALLAVVLLHECVCTADALYTHLAFVQAVRALHGHVVLVVKDNQPTFHADLVTYFTDPLARFEQAETVDYQRGCKECRRIKVTTALNAYLSASWPHVTQVAQLTRTVTTARKTSQQVVYLLTTLPPTMASPARLLELVRGHWGIENRLFYVRDVTFGEDRSQLRTGHAPQIMAALRNLVIMLIHRDGSTQIAACRRHFAFHPRQAFDLLLPRRYTLHSLRRST